MASLSTPSSQAIDCTSTRPVAYLRELEKKAKAHDAAFSHPPDLATGKAQDGLDYDDEVDFEGEHPLLEPFTQLSVDKPSTSFKGPASSDNFLRSVSKLSGFHGDDGSLDSNPNFYEPGALPSRRGVFGPNVRLPPLDIARRLFAAQYMYIGTIFAFTDPKDTFDEYLLQVYCGPPDRNDKEGCLLYAKVLVILAFGQLYSVNQWVDFRGPPGFGYFTSALILLPDPAP
ncbi:Transcriptional activator [Neonectria magnoliae]|uniref:Transcriptional activator n=1 Tax=Neonectria magnoliae TaxID=2732573 RepID=A0ABR1I6M1_9HYPO